MTDLHLIRNQISDFQRKAIRATTLDEFDEAIWNMEQIDMGLAKETGTKPADIRRLVLVGKPRRMS